MDRSLDEIVAESRSTTQRGGNRPRRGGRGGHGGGRQPREWERDSYPRDGVRKSTRDDKRGLDSDWVHDKFEGFQSRDRSHNPRRRRSPEPSQNERGTKIRVENLHYDLSESDLEGLFRKIGPIVKLELVYDRAGRSEGVAYVTYENRDDAMDAIREFNGANAKGQPIRMSIVSSAPRRNPFDTAQMPGRPLAERISRPRSHSPDRAVDSYVPNGHRRSHSPRPRRRGGRRAGTRRENGGEAGGREIGGRETGGRKTGRDGRPKKTQEELDAEMEDYFGGGGGNADAAAVSTGAANKTETGALAGDDVDMIE
ncbi:RNA-binding domain-containing protein [Poronia punctata]|nr:RNA-binding domain-containing protein [Poronia punctata]